MLSSSFMGWLQGSCQGLILNKLFTDSCTGHLCVLKTSESGKGQRGQHTSRVYIFKNLFTLGVWTMHRITLPWKGACGNDYSHCAPHLLTILSTATPADVLFFFFYCIIRTLSFSFDVIIITFAICLLRPCRGAIIFFLGLTLRLAHALDKRFNILYWGVSRYKHMLL